MTEAGVTSAAAVSNRQWVLVRRPQGAVAPEDFEYRVTPVPALADGECLVRTLYLSFDPALRLRLREGQSYFPSQPVGEVMRGGGLGQVVESRHADLRVGDIVAGMIGWQDFTVCGGGSPQFVSRLVPRHPLPKYLSVLGGTGLTAYFGLLHVGSLHAGDTVVVSAAAGATGSVAVQIAKIRQCRTIGIAGGAAKCQWLVDEYGLEGVIDYKNESVSARLAELCPEGIDLYFDNVGGTILEAAIDHMRERGRIVLCGMISTYNADGRPPGPSNLFELISRRVRMEGFLVGDFAPQFPAAVDELGAWLADGKLKSREDVREGFENILPTFARIFNGDNVGKQLLRVADPV